MADELVLDIRRLEEVAAELRKLPPVVRKRVMRRSARRGTALMRDRMRAAVPVDTGELKRNIMVRSRRGPPGTIKVSVIVRRQGKSQSKRVAGKRAGRYKNDPFYWRFLERGTKHIAPRGFFRRAFDTQADDVIDFIRRDALSEIKSETIKARQRVGR